MTTPLLENDQKLTDVEAAELLGVKPQTLRAWRSTKRAGSPRYVKIGSRVIYRRSDLDAFIERNTHGGESVER